MSVIRYLLCLLGVVLAMPLLVLTVLAFKLPTTISGVLYLAAGWLVSSGLITRPFDSKHSLTLVFTGVIGLLLIIGTRMTLTGQNRSSEIRMVTLPEQKGPRWVGSIIDEQDALVFGEELFHLAGYDSISEHESLVPAFLAAYSEMHSQGLFPSPVVNTYLNLQQPRAFDAVIVAPTGEPAFGVIFLHGFMGNVAAQCWEIAQAVKALGGVTICPSTEWTGHWWQTDGQEILVHTFTYLRDQGISRVYLGGFSNGGAGIGQTAFEWGGEEGLAGLFFIDGFTNGAGVRRLDLPVLIIEGTQDRRFPPAIAQGFAAEIGALATYAEIDSDHFLIMKQPKLVQNALTTWLKHQIVP